MPDQMLPPPNNGEPARAPAPQSWGPNGRSRNVAVGAGSSTAVAAAVVYALVQVGALQVGGASADGHSKELATHEFKELVAHVATLSTNVALLKQASDREKECIDKLEIMEQQTQHDVQDVKRDVAGILATIKRMSRRRRGRSFDDD